MSDKSDPETITSLRELFASLDAIYGIHTRLYKLNHTTYETTLWNLRMAKNISSGTLLNVKAAKFNILKTTSTIIAAILAVIGVAIQVLPINLYTVPLYIVVAFIIYVGILGFISYKNASKDEKEFEKIIQETEVIEDQIRKTIYDAENVCGGIESWIDYTYDQISSWLTLGLLAKDISKTTINTEIKQNYEDKLEISIKKLNNIKSANEKLYRNGVRTEEDYTKIDMKINNVLNKLQGEDYGD